MNTLQVNSLTALGREAVDALYQRYLGRPVRVMISPQMITALKRKGWVALDPPLRLSPDAVDAYAAWINETRQAGRRMKSERTEDALRKMLKYQKLAQRELGRKAS